MENTEVLHLVCSGLHRLVCYVKFSVFSLPLVHVYLPTRHPEPIACLNSSQCRSYYIDWFNYVGTVIVAWIWSFVVQLCSESKFWVGCILLNEIVALYCFVQIEIFFYNVPNHVPMHLFFSFMTQSWQCFPNTVRMIIAGG